MRSMIYERATAAFALMLLVTGLSYWFTVGHGATTLHRSSDFAWTVAIVLAGIKVRWVGLDFMELRRAPWRLRLSFELFVTGLVVALVTVNAVG